MAKLTIIKYTRRGVCDRKKCNAACCRILNLENGSWTNDNAITPIQRLVVYQNWSCGWLNSLADTSACGIYKNRPSPCKEFPSSPWDLIYLKIKDKCSYWFEIEIIVLDVHTSPVDSLEASPSPKSSIDDNSPGGN